MVYIIRLVPSLHITALDYLCLPIPATKFHLNIAVLRCPIAMVPYVMSLVTYVFIQGINSYD